MKSRFSNCELVAVVLALMVVCVTGCGSTTRAPRSSKAEAGPSAAGGVQPIVVPPQVTAPTKPSPVLNELGLRQIRASADSWEELVADEQPTLTWHQSDGGNYLLWVRDRAGTNEPTFEMDRAFGYQAENGKLQWILLTTPVDESLNRELSGYQVRGMAGLVTKQPAIRCDGCGNGDWAMILTAKSDPGTVYQIGWEGVSGGGTGHEIEEKLLYVFKDKSGKWQFMGEGPSNGSGKNGAMDCYQLFAQATDIAPNSRSPFGLEIHFTSERNDSECGRLDPRFAPRKLRVEYQDGTLDGRSTQVQWSRPYVKTEAGESFKTLVLHLATWDHGWDAEIPPSPGNIEKHIKIEAWWRQELMRLNPGISTGDIAEGTNVRIPTYAETVH